MADRRRINGPAGGTKAPVYRPLDIQVPHHLSNGTYGNRKLFLRTGSTPSASGSAYLETESLSQNGQTGPHFPQNASTKIACTVHGPRPLPRSAPFSPNILLSTHVKFAPFATRKRRGYLRDTSEKDLAVHLETALRSVIIGERWPKSGVDISVTILEAEEALGSDNSHSPENATDRSYIAMSKTLSNCVTVACAAIIDAGIDCVDVVVGGAAVLVLPPTKAQDDDSIEGAPAGELIVLANSMPLPQAEVVATLAIAYLPTRQEISELWLVGNEAEHDGSYENKSVKNIDKLIQCAIASAESSHLALREALKETFVRQENKG